MGSASSSFDATFAAEKETWAKRHDLELNQDIRSRQMELIHRFGNNLRLCYKENTILGFTYQHWFITDGDLTFEFGGGDIRNASVNSMIDTKCAFLIMVNIYTISFFKILYI